MKQSILKKIALLNKTTLDSVVESDVLKIIEHFTEIGLKILDADFGFAWWMIPEKTKYHLIYKSLNTPYEPELPRERGGNFKAKKTRMPVFVENVIKENYEEGFDVSMHMKSYVIIPITYAKYIYGSIVICFKDNHVFSEADRQLSVSLGNTTAQSITIHDFIEKEYKAVAVAAQQRANIEEGRRKMEEEELRTEFLADAMHEIRTPLAIIRGTVDLALNPKRMISQSEALESIDVEVQHLSEVLSELSMLTSKSVPVNRNIKNKKIKLATFIRKISKRWKILSNKRRVAIRIKKIPTVSILGDESYLNKLFTNIVKNAVIYGKNNSHISISGMIQEGRVRIDIQDDGIGISQQDLEHIFERFYRVDKSRTNYKDDPRTGLGLAIVKWIAEAHGGEVTVTSTLGKGSTFSVFLPYISL